MKPIAFKEATTDTGDGKKSLEAPVALRPCVFNGDRGTVATYCWGLSVRERLRLLATGRLWLTAITHTKRLQPMRIELDKPGHLSDAPNA
jgi:hypothetical protein